MLRFIGSLLVIGGVAGFLHSWITEQRERQKRLENVILFLEKSLYVMQTEKIKIADHLKRYIEQNMGQSEKKDMILEQVLKEILKRLSDNIYPNGQMIWEEVFREAQKSFHFDQEVFQIIVQAGNGFFGRSREENISFLQKSIQELERQQVKLKEKSAQERKVWIPVGMLGSVMLVILFL